MEIIANPNNKCFKLILLNLIILFLFKSLVIKRGKLEFYRYNYIENNNINKLSYHDILRNLNNLNSKINIASELLKIYSTLYDVGRDGKAIIPIFSNKTKEKSYPINKKGGICVCTMGKRENLYARQFVEYYQRLKVNKIIIFDNNDLNDEIFYDVLEDYVRSKFVDIIDVRGLKSILYPIYNFCYLINKNLYDWITFIDFDEYLFLVNYTNLNDYIYNKRFQKCQTIFFNWKMYNDDDLAIYDNRTLVERFKNVYQLSHQGKSFVRGGIDDLIVPTSMLPGINVEYFCNSNGERIFPISFLNGNNFNKNNSLAYLNHYYTKTAEEFCNKINKGDAQFHKNHPKYLNHINFKIKYFFSSNKITLKKIEILEKCLGINLDNYRYKIKK